MTCELSYILAPSSSYIAGTRLPCPLGMVYIFLLSLLTSPIVMEWTWKVFQAARGDSMAEVRSMILWRKRGHVSFINESGEGSRSIFWCPVDVGCYGKLWDDGGSCTLTRGRKFEIPSFSVSQWWDPLLFYAVVNKAFGKLLMRSPRFVVFDLPGCLHGY